MTCYTDCKEKGKINIHLCCVVLCCELRTNPVLIMVQLWCNARPTWQAKKLNSATRVRLVYEANGKHIWTLFSPHFNYDSAAIGSHCSPRGKYMLAVASLLFKAVENIEVIVLNLEQVQELMQECVCWKRLGNFRTLYWVSR